MTLRNLTIESGNVTVLKYVGKWNVDGFWNAGSTGESGSLSSSNDPNAKITFDFPVPANAFYYYGMKRSNGGLYAICIDDPNCNSQSPNSTKIDAFDQHDDGQQPPVLLFHTFVDFGHHQITLINLHDQRSTPPGNSQITLDRFEIQVENSSGQITSSTPSTLISTSSYFSQSHSTHSPSVLGSFSGPFPSPSVSKLASPVPSVDTSDSPIPLAPSLPVGAIVGGVIGGFFLLLLLVLFCVRRQYLRRQKRTFRSSFATYSTAPNLSSFGSVSNVYSSSSADRSQSFASYGYGVGAGLTDMHRLPIDDSSYAPTSVSASTRSRSRSRSKTKSRSRSHRPRRAVDAGRITISGYQEIDEDAQPPNYHQDSKTGFA